MSLMTIKIDNCIFPVNYLYDIQNFTWADFNYNNVEKDLDDEYKLVKVGIMPILSYIAGNIRKIKLKQIGETVTQGKSIGTIESMSYFGVIRSPISGKIIETNNDLLTNPKRVNDSP